METSHPPTKFLAKASRQLCVSHFKGDNKMKPLITTQHHRTRTTNIAVEGIQFRHQVTNI